MRQHEPPARQYLAWPREGGLDPLPSAELLAPGSNVVLDLHGDPTRARLRVFSDGNHHMALADVVAAFAEREPGVMDVFYATAPPRILLEALATGRIALGNLVLSARPHVFVSPLEILSRLHQEGAIGEPRVFASSRGTAILVRKDNPRSVSAIADLARPDVRLALSNPVTEQASFEVYASAIISECAAAGTRRSTIEQWLRSDAVVKSRVIHHREIPELIASNSADASLVYRHLALRYVRIFPDLFDILPGSVGPVTQYAVALAGDGGVFGASFARALLAADGQSIYRRHGLEPVSQSA